MNWIFFTLFASASLYALHRLAALITRHEEEHAARAAALIRFDDEPPYTPAQSLKDTAAAFALAVLAFAFFVLAFAQ